MNPTRDDAWNLLTHYTQSESLIKHALSVEAVMRHFATLYEEDTEKWGIIGLIHDLDYEKYPDDHCQYTEKILHQAGWPDEYIRAALSHAWGICTNVQPIHMMEKVLYATDELTGLITAVALVRPSRSIMDLKVKSVNKKWNVNTFAAGASREVIKNGAGMMGVSLEYWYYPYFSG